MALDDTGLVVRYYLDEATSGTAPTSAADAGPNNYDLDAISYGSSTLAWTASGANAGLNSSSATGTHYLKKQMGNTGDALRTALSGGNKFTIELVMAITGGSGSDFGKIFGINDRVGSYSTFGVTYNGASFAAFWEYNRINAWVGTTSRAVFHFVFDATQAISTDRVRLYLNGVLQTVGSTHNAIGGTLDIPTNTDLIAFTRESSGNYGEGSIGTIFYASIYNVAFDATRASDHYGVLTLDDDTPSSAASPVPIFASQYRHRR